LALLAGNADEVRLADHPVHALGAVDDLAHLEVRGGAEVGEGGGAVHARTSVRKRIDSRTASFIASSRSGFRPMAAQ